MIFIRSSEAATQWNYLLLFSPLPSSNNFGTAAALWERAGRKNVCRASEVEGHLKIIYFKTFIPQTGQLKFREGKQLAKVTLLFHSRSSDRIQGS